MDYIEFKFFVKIWHKTVVVVFVVVFLFLLAFFCFVMYTKCIQKISDRVFVLFSFEQF